MEIVPVIVFEEGKQLLLGIDPVARELQRSEIRAAGQLTAEAAGASAFSTDYVAGVELGIATGRCHTVLKSLQIVELAFQSNAVVEDTLDDLRSLLT
jgi:hypothetical protein